MTNGDTWPRDEPWFLFPLPPLRRPPEIRNVLRGSYFPASFSHTFNNTVSQKHEHENKSYQMHASLCFGWPGLNQFQLLDQIRDEIGLFLR